MNSRKVVIQRDIKQLHSNDIAKFIQCMCRYHCSITLQSGEHSANAASMMGIFALQMRPAMEITVTAQGPDENAALQEACDWLNGK